MASMREELRDSPDGFVEVATRRSRESLNIRVRRLRRTSLTILQCALAAGLAWLVAKHVVGHGSPFFAPVAAILTLGLTFGQRGRRAAELAVGVALGIGVGDLLVFIIGTGWWQITVVVFLAMAAAVLVGGGTLLVNQCAVSAVLVATIQVPTNGVDPSRWLDALIGCGFALLVSAVVPTDPVRLVRREADPLLTELAAALDDIAGGLERRDPELTAAALTRARSIDQAEARFREAVAVAQETITMSISRRRARAELNPYDTAIVGVDNAIRNTRVLARGVRRAVETGEHVPELAVVAVRDLAEAVRALRDELAEQRGRARTEEAALRAAARSTAALEETGNLSASVIVGQIRSTAVDLLVGQGVEPEEARSAVRDARARLGV